MAGATAAFNAPPCARLDRASLDQFTLGDQLRPVRALAIVPFAPSRPHAGTCETRTCRPARPPSTWQLQEELPHASGLVPVLDEAQSDKEVSPAPRVAPAAREPLAVVPCTIPS